MAQPISAFWFRRDLRLEDNRGLFAALSAAQKSGATVLPVFIFDPKILGRLKSLEDARVTFIYQRLVDLQQQLQSQGSDLVIAHGDPQEVWPKLASRYKIAHIFLNHDYEPYARDRDRKVESWAKKQEIRFSTFKDQVVFEKSEIVKENGQPYSVYTPYSRKWREALNKSDLQPLSSPMTAFHKFRSESSPALKDLGFQRSSLPVPPSTWPVPDLKKYALQRNRPDIAGTSRLGLHLRFGTVSIRALAQLALKHSDVWLSELIWREFFMQILFHHPHVQERAYRPEYNFIAWRKAPQEFMRWCEGKTGYPIVDAGMRELNTTGFMHNRVRMITASFLCKHLGIDYRWGEDYFAQKLLDFDLSANNGNWQWVAGTGCDAAPYFRVFNPDLQAKKFDPDGKYVALWVPELHSSDYPEPMVDPKVARLRALKMYKEGLEKSQKESR